MFGEMSSVNRFQVVVPHGALCTQDLFVSARLRTCVRSNREGRGREEGKTSVFREQETEAGMYVNHSPWSAKGSGLAGGQS